MTGSHGPFQDDETLPVPNTAPAPLGRYQLVVMAEGATTTHWLPPGPVVLGRSPEATVVVDHPSLSRRHALLVLGPSLSVQDLGSRNGTRVRGRPLAAEERAEVHPGEMVELGSVMVVVVAPSPPAPRVALPNASLRGGAPEPLPSAESPGVMGPLRALMERVAQTNVSVIILGETGVGKEVAAQAIHRCSPRAGGPFVGINCGALTESLLESELFGYERGAFTGAAAAKPGLLESADGGTLFLDEIGDMPPTLQVKLLRVLEERAVRRVGALKPRAIDVRVLAATHRDLAEAMARGSFRQDLYYRLNGITLTIPPLRERTGELAGLVELFAHQFTRGQRAVRFSPQALEHLKAYPWPGNIRELRNLVERTVALCPADTIEPEHLPLDQLGVTVLHARPAAATRLPADLAPAPLAAPPAAPPTSKEAFRAADKQRILDALQSCAGNQSRAAELLGMSRRGLINRLDEYGIPRPRKQE